MYVYYDNYDRGSHISVRDYSDAESQYKPSECIWMVPGTVDPMED